MKPASLQKGPVNKQDLEMHLVRESIIRTLVYFDLFQYPLTSEEVRIFLERKTTELVVHEALTQLLKDKRIFLSNGFFSLTDNTLYAIRRKEGNLRAEKLLKKAERIGRFLYRFPFVRGIGISGSLSKNYAAENADIDFFIITKTGRLWIARTLMHLFKKFTFLTGRQHYYCMNYYLDEEVLFLEEQNIFTAIEIITLVPVAGKESLSLFFEKNNWTHHWFPAFTIKKQKRKDPVTWLKPIAEWMLNGKAGRRLEKYLFDLTEKRWERKSLKNKKNIKGESMELISGRHFALSNPGNFREGILQKYGEKLVKHQPAEQNNFTISIVR